MSNRIKDNANSVAKTSLVELLGGITKGHIGKISLNAM